MRGKYADTRTIDIAYEPAAPSTYNVTAKNRFLGTLQYVSDIKLHVEPTSLNGISGPYFSVTGNFKESRFILIQKNAESREQKYIGEAMGQRSMGNKVRKMRNFEASMNLFF